MMSPNEDTSGEPQVTPFGPDGQPISVPKGSPADKG